MGKPGALVICDLLTEVPSPVRDPRFEYPRGQDPAGLLTVTEAQSKPRARGEEGRGSSHSRPGCLLERWDLKELWPASSARGCHELVTSHNLVDPGPAKRLTL